MRIGQPAVADAAAPGRSIPWLILLLALAVRLVVIGGTIGFHTPAASEPTADSRIHITLAQHLLTGRGYSMAGSPTAATPPLYVFSLTGLYWLFPDPAAVRLAQAALGAVSCVTLYGIGRAMFDRATGIVAALILSFSPLAAYLTALHVTENLFLFLILLALAQSMHVAARPALFSAGCLGGLLGLAALTRAVFLAVIPFLLVWTMSQWGGRNPLGYRIYGIVVLAAAAVILPWTIRNYVVLHAVTPVQSNAGMMFWAGNNSHADGGLVWPTRDTWAATRPPDDGSYGWREMPLGEENRLYASTALAWITTHPRRYLHLLGRKLVRLYGFTRGEDGRGFPVPRPLMIAHVVFLTLALAGLALNVHRWRVVSLLLVLVFVTHLTTLLFSGATRYIVPMLPSLTLFSAAALVAIWTSAARIARRHRLAASR